MLTKEIIENGIVKITASGVFDVKDWNDYQQMMLDTLNASDSKLYMLTDFSQIETFSKEIVPQAGTAKHLTHENLGLLVLLGGNALQNFILQITDNRARKEAKGSKMRVHTDYDRAIDTLLHFKQMHKDMAAHE